MRLSALNESASAGWAARLFAYGGCALVGIWLLSWIVGSLIAPLKVVGQTRTCQSNIVRLSRGFTMYADDYDDHYTPTARWMGNCRFYLPQAPEGRQLHCPTVSGEGETNYGYAMNATLGGKERARITTPETTPLIYDSSNLKPDAADAVTSLPKPGRHRVSKKRGTPLKPGNSVGYANGRVGFILDGERKP